MKKIFLASLTLLLSIPAVHAQKLYVRGALGFAIANAGQTLDDSRSPYSGTMTYVSTNNGTSTALSSFRIKPVSFNTGIQGSVALGYMFTNNVGAELGADIGIAHIVYEGEITSPQASNPAYTVTQFYSQYVKNPVVLTPALYLQSGGKKINIYTRAGLVVPLKSKLTAEVGEITTATGTNVSRSINIGYDVSTSFKLGLAGAVGVKYAVNPRLQLSMEISTTSLSLFLDELTITSYSIDGANVFSQIPEQSRKISYSRSGSTNTPPTYSIPFGNAALRAGVFYTLR